MLEARLSPPVISRHPGQEEGGGGFAVDALLPALGNGPVNGAVDDGRIHGIGLGNGVGHQHTPPRAISFWALKASRQLPGVSIR